MIELRYNGLNTDGEDLPIRRTEWVSARGQVIVTNCFESPLVAMTSAL
jgi:hypothetical protein